MADSSVLQDWLIWSLSPAESAVVVTLIIALILPLFLHFYLYRNAGVKEPPAFLLLGPSGAGKTSFLALFATGVNASTHTSQAPQTALCQLPTAIRSAGDRYRSENDTTAREQPKFLLLDTPGHGKLRHHATSAITGPAAWKGLIFVVDSAAISSPAGLTVTAEYLHDVLLLLQTRRAQAKTSKDAPTIPVLVAANKQDVFTSLPVGLAKAKLEGEIAKVRETRSKGLLDSGVGMGNDAGADEESHWLGEFGSKQFKFAQMDEYGVDVKVVGGNLRGEGDAGGKVDAWWTWIAENL